MTRRAFLSQFLVVLVSSAVAASADSALGALRAGLDAPRAALQHFGWSLGVWGLPCALWAALSALLLAALIDDRPLQLAVREQWARAEQRERLGAALLVAAPLLACVYALALGLRRYHNAELAAALLTFLVSSALLLSLACLPLLLGWVRRGRARGAAARLLRWALALDALVLCWLVLESWSGLAQLDGGLIAAPLGFVAAGIWCDRSPRIRALGLRALWLLLTPLGALLLWTLLSGEIAGVELARRGVWSPYLVAGLRTASDLDGDGYSSLLGGGDCAPLDSAVHPGASEISGDGIDNNCVGGDAGGDWQARRPSWGAQVHGSPKNLNVVIVTIETFRRDHASFLRSERDTTPELRALAKDALVFERMYSAAPLTRLALASLFSSYAPSEIAWQPQGREKRMRRIGPETPWLPELLGARGYDTLAVLTDFSAFTPQEDAGFERGFRHYDLSTRLEYRGGTMRGFPAAEQLDKTLVLLQTLKRPFLLWVHLFEPHYVYEQPAGAPVFGEGEQARYDAEIWHVDRQLGRLFRELRRLGMWDETVLFVSGDHGEAFGEHQDRWHGSNLHDPQLCPAALLRVPGVTGRRVAEAVTFTDIAPTIARVLGERQIFDRLRGRSLTPFLHGKPLPEGSRGFVVESFSVDDGHAYQAAFIDYPLKLIYSEDGRRFSLFDLQRDPLERRALDASSDPRASSLLKSLTGYLEHARPRSSTGAALGGR